MCDMVDGIRGVTLGSIESSVIEAAGKAIIRNWNDHNDDDQIDVKVELAEWKQEIEEMD